MIPESLLRGDADELLHQAASELRIHLETGEDCHAETILSHFPSLASDPHRSLELIVLEFQYRQQLGQNPQPTEWYQRFPHWRELLQARLEAPSSKLRESGELEAATIQTAPYFDANPLTAVEADVDAPVLGRHEILDELDRGGMGVVYRARDWTLDRVVALKVIRSGALASEEEVQRFYREARAAAQLRHPHIVPIYGMGLYQGQHCFTMALFPRGSLNRYLANYSRDVRGAVSLLAKVARAVQAAHERGIVHRDLKPGNILLDEHGEPVVSDFGLAKRMDVSATLTLPAHPVGTPAYMSPEQARCEAATAASDIWSLGVILYELLTGRRPFSADAADKATHQILHAEVVPPRRLRPHLPRDLETIVLTCLEKEPMRRYPSAAALADDLERWQRGEAVQARPEPRWRRLRRQFRRRLSSKGALLLGLILLGAGAAGYSGIFSYFSPQERERRRQERVLDSLQRDLAEGKSVVLVPALGPPPWYRWLAETDRPALPELRKWPLKLAANQGRVLLELLPESQQNSYRFRAEVRPLGQDKMQIGLFFGRQELAAPTRPQQFFGLFRLSALGNQLNQAEFCLVGYCEREVDERSKWHEFLPPFKPQPGLFPALRQPPPDNPRESLWRRIEVQVRPDRVQAFCEGCLANNFSVAARYKPLVRGGWRTTHPAAPLVPSFSPRGGLGLYLSGGAAFFRNVVVEPLPQP